MANPNQGLYGRFNIGGVDLINDASGIRRADGTPWGMVALDPLGPQNNDWASVIGAVKNGNTSVLGDLAPYAQQLIARNNDIASQEHYEDAPLSEGLRNFAMAMAAAYGAAGLAGAGGAGAGLGAGGAMDMGVGLGGNLGAWGGITPLEGAGSFAGYGGGMSFDPFADFGADYFSGASNYTGGGIDPFADFGGDYFSGANNYTGSGTFGTVPGSQISPGLLEQLKSMPGGSSMIQKLLGGNSMGALGGLLGALAGGVGANSKPAGSITSVQDIPDYLKPYQAMNLTSGVQNFGIAGQGAALLPGAMDQLGRTISGQYLDPNTNPAFQPYVKDLMGNALSTYTGQFGGAAGGNMNNTGFQEGAARAITNAVLPLYNSAFQTERGNQINAASQAPGFASNYAGAALAPNLAFKNLYTGPQATTTPYFSNPLGGALSGGLAGYTLGNSFGK